MSLPERMPPGWSALDRARTPEPRPLAELSDEELWAGYERAKLEVPPDIAAEVAAMTDAELLAAYEELTR